MPLKGVRHVKVKTSSKTSSSFSLRGCSQCCSSHDVPPISNNLPLFGFDDAKQNYDRVHLEGLSLEIGALILRLILKNS